MWAGENWSDVEAKLKSEEPMEMGGDASTSKGSSDSSSASTSLLFSIAHMRLAISCTF